MPNPVQRPMKETAQRLQKPEILQLWDFCVNKRKKLSIPWTQEQRDDFWKDLYDNIRAALDAKGWRGTELTAELRRMKGLPRERAVVVNNQHIQKFPKR